MEEGDIEINDIMKIDPKVRLFVLALNEAHMQDLDNCMKIFEKIFGKVDDEYETTINEIWINRKNPYNISDTIKNIFFYKIFDNLKKKATLLDQIVYSDDRVIKKVSLDTQVLERILQAKLYVDTYKSLENIGIVVNKTNGNYSLNSDNLDNKRSIPIDNKYKYFVDKMKLKKIYSFILEKNKYNDRTPFYIDTEASPNTIQKIHIILQSLIEGKLGTYIFELKKEKKIEFPQFSFDTNLLDKLKNIIEKSIILLKNHLEDVLSNINFINFIAIRNNFEGINNNINKLCSYLKIYIKEENFIDRITLVEKQFYNNYTKIFNKLNENIKPIESIIKKVNEKSYNINIETIKEDLKTINNKNILYEEEIIDYLVIFITYIYYFLVEKTEETDETKDADKELKSYLDSFMKKFEKNDLKTKIKKSLSVKIQEQEQLNKKKSSGTSNKNPFQHLEVTQSPLLSQLNI